MKGQVKTTLYKITDDIQALDGCLDGEEKEEAVVYITKLLEDKIDGIVGYNRYLNDTMESITKRVDELNNLKKSINNKQQNFAEYITYCLDKVGIDEAVGDLERIVIPKAKKVVEVTNPDKIPMQFVTVERNIKVNKAELKKHLSMGYLVKGACLVDGKRGAQFKPIKAGQSKKLTDKSKEVE